MILPATQARRRSHGLESSCDDGTAREHQRTKDNLGAGERHPATAHPSVPVSPLAYVGRQPLPSPPPGVLLRDPWHHDDPGTRGYEDEGEGGVP